MLKNMNKGLSLLLLLTVIFSTLLTFDQESYRHELVKSDGRGYYAYLPALLIFQDNDYQKVLETEKRTFEGRNTQTYLFKHENGRIFNKYFPGVAVMQAPFFVVASGIAYITGGEVNGYSNPYLWMLYFGALFYTLIGLVFFYKTLHWFSGNSKHALWGVGLVFFGTQLFFNTLAEPSFSHPYSFFLLSLISWTFIRFQQHPTIKKTLLMGVLLGLVFLVRPTNVLFALFLPFLLKEKKQITSFFNWIFHLKNGHLGLLFIVFLFFVSFLPILWKWQTGEWWVWSYNGEGFDFSDPKFFETLWSFRIGIFVHTPMLLAAFFGLFFLFKKHPLASGIWVFYLLLLTFVTSSWWCWDYEWSFGHRVFNDHFIIFSFPLVVLFKQQKWRKITISFLSIAMIYNGFRFYQLHSGIFPVQRFTKETYSLSLLEWTPGEEKFNYLLHCKPLGSIKNQTTISYSEGQSSALSSGGEFTPALEYYFPENFHNNRFAFEATFDKRLTHNDQDWKDVFLVFDATNTKTEGRIYQAIPVYEFYKEGEDYWHHTRLQHEIPVAFDPMEKVSIYFWNPQKKPVEIDNLKITVEEISNE